MGVAVTARLREVYGITRRFATSNLLLFLEKVTETIWF
jgi:hypothetical protein